MGLAKSLAAGVAVGIVIVVAVAFGQGLLGGSGASYGCPSLFGLAHFSGTGFLIDNGAQYVIKQGSTAFVTVNYTGIYNATAVFDGVAPYSPRPFGPVKEWFRVSPTGVANVTGYLSPAEAGLSAIPVSVSLGGNHSIVAVYLLNATASAPSAAYLASSFPSTCGPSPLIVVGNSLYTGSFDVTYA